MGTYVIGATGPFKGIKLRPNKTMLMRKKLFKITLVLTAIMIALLATSGSFLVVNRPAQADVIVVLAGEAESRPLRGLELLNHNYAPRLILDVPAEDQIYGHRETELAKDYKDQFPRKDSISICPVFGLSTKAEVNDVKNCLQGTPVRRVLLVTSEFHTRRALSIFNKEAPAINFSVAAAFDSSRFSTHWWARREWAKTNLDEWLRLLWWDLVDRWR